MDDSYSPNGQRKKNRFDPLNLNPRTTFQFQALFRSQKQSVVQNIQIKSIKPFLKLSIFVLKNSRSTFQLQALFRSQNQSIDENIQLKSIVTFFSTAYFWAENICYTQNKTEDAFSNPCMIRHTRSNNVHFEKYCSCRKWSKTHMWPFSDHICTWLIYILWPPNDP